LCLREPPVAAALGGALAGALAAPLAGFLEPNKPVILPRIPGDAGALAGAVAVAFAGGGALI